MKFSLNILYILTGMLISTSLSAGTSRVTIPTLPPSASVLQEWAQDLSLWCPVDDLFLLADALDQKAGDAFSRQLTMMGKSLAQLQGIIDRYGWHRALQIARPWVTAASIYWAIRSISNTAQKYNISLPISIAKVDDRVIDFIPSVGTISAMVLNKTLFANSGSCEKNPIGLFAQDFVDSYRLAHTLGTEVVSDTWDSLCGVRHKSTLPVKPASRALVSAQEQAILPLLICANNPEAFFNLQFKYPRGILLNQSNYTANRDIALGLAGSLENWATAHGHTGGWGTYEIHASELLSTKPISKIVATLQTFGKTVLIIHDIEWLYTQMDIGNDEAAYRSAIITELKKLMSDDSRLQVVVVLTTTVKHAELTKIINEPSLWYPGKLMYWHISQLS
jgi:hypothetical protein